MSLPELTPSAFFDLEGWEHAALFEGHGRPWEALGKALEVYLSRVLEPGIAGTVEPGAVLVGDNICLGEGSVIEAGAYVRGPALIGRDVEVRHGAYIRGNVLVGDGSVVGHATEVKGSVFLPGAKAGHFAYVGDSILGRNCNLGAGTKLANLRLANDEVIIRVGDTRVRTGMRKLGAILGDGAQTGCNSVTNPGTLMPRGALLLPCAVASGWHAGR